MHISSYNLSIARLCWVVTAGTYTVPINILIEIEHTGTGTKSQREGEREREREHSKPPFLIRKTGLVDMYSTSGTTLTLAGQHASFFLQHPQLPH